MRKTTIILSILAIVGGVVLGGYGYFSGEKTPDYNFVVAQKGEVIQEVSVVGRVKPARAADLAFEKSGKVSGVYAEIGQKVQTGQILARLENSELLAQLLQVEANLEAEEIKLTELKKGTRPEEIQSARTKSAGAEQSLKDAEINLKNVLNKAAVDLRDTYENALSAAQKSVTVAKNALLALTDIQSAHFTDLSQESLFLGETKAQAALVLLGAQNAGRWQSEFISPLSGGAFGFVKEAATANHVQENIDQALQETIESLKKVKIALEAVPLTTKLTSTEKTNLITEQNNINAEMAAITQKQGAVETQKAANTNAIASAETNVNQAKNVLAGAEDDLVLKKAGATEEQILSQKAKIKSSRAAVQNIRAQIEKTIIRSPISGFVVKQEAEAGEIASANTPIISLISETQFQIEANVAEADMAKVKIEDEAKLTVDAYGRDVVFQARVIAIEPAETIIDGLAAYKTTLQFLQNDERIKSGLTANIEILTDKRENVIAIPQRAVIPKDGEQLVKILTDNKIQEIKIKTGLRGSDGNIEIIEGIREGDRVITFYKEEK